MAVTDASQILSMPLFLTVEQASDILQCHPRTITRMCERGDLPACRVGNRWKVNRDKLMEYCGLEVEPQPRRPLRDALCRSTGRCSGRW